MRSLVSFLTDISDGVSLRVREGVAFLRDEELLVVELGVDEEEDPLTLSFLNTNELN